MPPEAEVEAALKRFFRVVGRQDLPDLSASGDVAWYAHLLDARIESSRRPKQTWTDARLASSNDAVAAG